MKIKQGKPRSAIGGFQVQLAGTMSFYMVYINLAMMGMMFWHTTAYPMLSPHLPWVNMAYFVGLMIIVIVSVMYLDYKHMVPSRTAFQSKQAYKHQNPLVKDIYVMLEVQTENGKRLTNIENMLVELTKANKGGV